MASNALFHLTLVGLVSLETLAPSHVNRRTSRLEMRVSAHARWWNVTGSVVVSRM
jgi:hypothetical protein